MTNCYPLIYFTLYYLSIHEITIIQHSINNTVFYGTF